MKSPSKSLIIFGFSLLIVFLLQACAGSGQAGSSRNWIDYNENFERMKSVVQQAIKGSILNVNHVQEADNKEEVKIIFGKSYSVNNESVQQEQGTITIRKVAEGKTKIRIENPDYHYTVPDYEREDYRRILKSRIDDILNDNL